MLPTKSNTAEQGCSPISSNCVIWQGPAITCLNLCNGDTVSDVVYKVAQDLCTIKDELDLSDLDLTCLVSFCTSVNPAPTTKTLSAVLDFIIDKVCCLNTRITSLESGSGGGDGSYTEPTLALPTCLQYINPANGQTVTQLIHNQYTLRLASQFCSLKVTVDQHVTQISNLTSRVTVLENATGYVAPTVIPNCLLTPGTPTQMNVLLDELENQFCLLRSVLGTNIQITAATASQCAGLNNANALSQAGIMSNIPGWNSTIGSMAQAFQNLWLTVCDLRAAMADIKNCCSQVDCTQFVLNYDASTNEDRTVVSLDFNPTTIIPAGFVNAVSGSTVTISDGTTSKTFTVDLTAFATTGVFTAIVAGGSVVGAALNTSQVYTVTVNGNIVKSSQTCSKTVVKTISVPCPVITGVTAQLV
jgi:hypothetical protein